MKTNQAHVVYLIGALGDTVIAIPALRAIRARWPERSLLLMYNDDRNGRVTARDVLDGTGLVDEFLPYDASRGWRESLRVLRDLRRRRIGTAIYLAPGARRRRSVIRDRWFFRLAGAKRLAGFIAGEFSGLHEGGARLERLRLSGIPAGAEVHRTPLLRPTATALDTVAKWLGERGLRGERPLVGIGPGSQMPAKHWPIERFAELGRRIAARFPVDLIVTGGPGEQAAGEFLRTAWGGGLNAAGAFTVAESAALFSRVDLLVTLDTGPMHLAAAVGTPCVALFSGIEVPGKWDPAGEGHIVIRKQVECAGCRLTECPRVEHACMTRITVDDVWESVLAKAAEWKGVCV